MRTNEWQDGKRPGLRTEGLFQKESWIGGGRGVCPGLGLSLGIELGCMKA